MTGHGSKTEDRRRQKQRHQNAVHETAVAGFTLVELLVVLALVAALTSLMTVSLGQIAKIRSIDQQVQLQSTADTIADLIANDIRGALNVPLVGPQTVEGLTMSGTPDAVTFTAIVRTGFNARGLRETRYLVREVAGVSTLVRETSPYRTRPDGSPDLTVTEPIWTGTEKITFRYLAGGSDPRAWKNEWQVEHRLPAAIRFELELADADRTLHVHRTVWLSFVIVCCAEIVQKRYAPHSAAS